MPKICLIFVCRHVCERHRILYQSKSLKSSNSRVFNLPELCELLTFFLALLHHKLTSSRTQFSSGFGRNADKNDALAQQLELARVRKPVIDSSVSTLILCSDCMPGNVWNAYCCCVVQGRINLGLVEQTSGLVEQTSGISPHILAQPACMFWILHAIPQPRENYYKLVFTRFLFDFLPQNWREETMPSWRSNLRQNYGRKPWQKLFLERDLAAETPFCQVWTQWKKVPWQSEKEP